MIDKDGKKQIMPEPIASSYDYKCHTGLIKFKVNMEQFSLENEPFVDSFKAYLKGTIHILRNNFQWGEGDQRLPEMGPSFENVGRSNIAVPSIY